MLPNNMMDEGRLHKIAVEEMCTERRMNGGGSKWLLGCWTEAHPRTSAYCRTILTMNQTGASTCAEGTKHISSTKRTNTKPAGLAWKKRSPHQGRKKRTPQVRKKRAPLACKERAPQARRERAGRQARRKRAPTIGT